MRQIYMNKTLKLEYMKKIFLGIFVLSLFVLNSCLNDDDSYSLGDIYIGLGIMEDAQTNKIVLDNGDILIPVAYEYPWHDDSDVYNGFQDGDRVFVNFTILDDNATDSSEVVTYYVKLNLVKEILMKGIIDITPEIEDSIGNDPIIVQDAWVTNNLLNLKIKYWGRDKTHFINLVKQPGNLTGAEQPFELELRHNDNEDIKSISYSSYVSFKLDELEISGLDSVQFNVSCTDYDGGEFEYKGVFKYEDDN